MGGGARGRGGIARRDVEGTHWSRSPTLRSTFSSPYSVLSVLHCGAAAHRVWVRARAAATRRGAGAPRRAPKRAARPAGFARERVADIVRRSVDARGGRRGVWRERSRPGALFGGPPRPPSDVRPNRRSVGESSIVSDSAHGRGWARCTNRLALTGRRALVGDVRAARCPRNRSWLA